jgi:hypothetical protein
MNREILLSVNEGEARARCFEANVGVSAIERLVDGGVRLVCMSGRGAELIRTKLKSSVIEGDVIRTRIRPRSPLW